VRGKDGESKDSPPSLSLPPTGEPDELTRGEGEREGEREREKKRKTCPSMFYMYICIRANLPSI